MQAELDQQFMALAIEQANCAALAGEVPVGAVLVRNGQVLAKGFNQPIGLHDPSAHAEMQVLRAAGQVEGNYRLPGTTLYVTLEPCAMCAGAMFHARVDRVVYGAPDPKTGAAGSALNLFAYQQINHQTQTQGGVLAEECSHVLKRFFKERR
jgi:tRNA(adenine34) deaminase